MLPHAIDCSLDGNAGSGSVPGAAVPRNPHGGPRQPGAAASFAPASDMGSDATFPSRELDPPYGNLGSASLPRSPDRQGQVGESLSCCNDPEIWRGTNL